MSMSFNGIYHFGTITTKNGKVLDFDDIDKDRDGKISQQEYNFIQKNLCMDTLEIENGDKKGEKNVTDYEFVLWQEESKMQERLDEMQSQVAMDFIGAKAKLAPQVLRELKDFHDDFKEGCKNSADSIINMAEKFDAALPVKYEEIKARLLAK